MAEGRAADVKACYALREGFALFDYEDESSSDTQKLMLQAAMSSAFLHRADGRKFVSFVFRLHAPLVADLTAVVKNQVGACPRFLLCLRARRVGRQPGPRQPRRPCVCSGEWSAVPGHGAFPSQP